LPAIEQHRSLARYCRRRTRSAQCVTKIADVRALPRRRQPVVLARHDPRSIPGENGTDANNPWRWSAADGKTTRTSPPRSASRRVGRTNVARKHGPRERTQSSARPDEVGGGDPNASRRKFSAFLMLESGQRAAMFDDRAPGSRTGPGFPCECGGRTAAFEAVRLGPTPRQGICVLGV
jgi:hypothetical protein